MHTTIRTVGLALVLASCQHSQPSEQTGGAHSGSDEAALSPEQQVAQRAQAHLVPLKKGLMGALSRAMKEHGPAGALEACRLEAPKVTASAQQESVRVGRTSTKLRNPENAPAEWMEPPLAELAAAPADDRGWRVVDLPGDEVAYVETIRVQGLCLRCHGSDLAPEVQAALRASYPNDRATGYEAGDFRGMFWVVLAESPPDAP